MFVYKIYKGKVTAIKVAKKTNCYYWFETDQAAFGYLTRIEKEYACLTPQEAIQEALNGRRTMYGAFKDKLVKVKSEIANLEKLEKQNERNLL